AVLLVVRVELHAAADDLLVARVRLDRVDLHDDRLVHRVRDDDAAALLTAAALRLPLRWAGNWLAARWSFSRPPRVRVALGARQALPLLLRLRDRLGRGRSCLGRGFRRSRGLVFGCLGALDFFSH